MEQGECVCRVNCIEVLFWFYCTRRKSGGGERTASLNILNAGREEEKTNWTFSRSFLFLFFFSGSLFISRCICQTNERVFYLLHRMKTAIKYYVCRRASNQRRRTRKDRMRGSEFFTYFSSSVLLRIMQRRVNLHRRLHWTEQKRSVTPLVTGWVVRVPFSISVHQQRDPLWNWLTDDYSPATISMYSNCIVPRRLATMRWGVGWDWMEGLPIEKVHGPGHSVTCTFLVHSERRRRGNLLLFAVRIGMNEYIPHFTGEK